MLPVEELVLVAVRNGTTGLATIRSVWTSLEAHDPSLSLTYHSKERLFTIENSNQLSLDILERLVFRRYEGWAPKLLGADTQGNHVFCLIPLDYDGRPCEIHKVALHTLFDFLSSYIQQTCSIGPASHTPKQLPAPAQPQCQMVALRAIPRSPAVTCIQLRPSQNKIVHLRKNEQTPLTLTEAVLDEMEDIMKSLIRCLFPWCLPGKS
ncbi:MAG: hypothetical protein LLG04_06330 [Parachlamydia sp.]|nr:hypothetical protein [Parachlamydia sp.]